MNSVPPWLVSPSEEIIKSKIEIDNVIVETENSIGQLKEILKDKIGFRVVRPGKEDESGTIHTDSYSRNFDSFITIWIPLIGFNRKYTLRYAKKSHLNTHSKNKKKKKYRRLRKHASISIKNKKK